MRHSRALRNAEAIGVVLAVAVAYYLAGKAGLRLAFVNASATAVWPPTGIALASLLVFGARAWPGVFLGALLVNATTAGTLLTSLGIASGNTLEGLLGAWLVRRFASGTRAFERPGDIFRFAGLAGVLATLVSASVGLTSLAVGGFAPWPPDRATWLTWWLGDLGGALVIAPFLLLWRDPLRGWKLAERWVEGGLMGAMVVASGLLVFAGMSPFPDKGYPLDFLTVPPLLWAAFRFGPRTVSACVVSLSGIAIFGTLRGLGPFGSYDPRESLALLQAYMAVTSVIYLAVAATVAESRRNEARVRAFNQVLEQRVEDATRKLRVSNQALRERIHESETATERLEKSEARLREAQSVARIGSWEWDVERNLVWWSEALYDIYGLDPKGFGASLEAYLEHVHPDDRERARCTVQTALRDQESFTFEHRIVRPDGEVVTLLARGRVLTDERGRPVRMVGTGLDVTERKRAEEQRADLIREQAARRQAEQASRFKDEFLATLAHELRNPLNAVVNWARLLRRGGLDPRTEARAIEVITLNADLQSYLIRDLLDHATISSGRLELRKELTELAGVIEGAVESIRPAAQTKRVALRSRLNGNGKKVLGDPNRLRQVVTNLVSNAVRFAPEGGWVEVSFTTDATTARIRVEDNGPGIAPELLPHVFDRFRRGDSASDGQGGGLGLGLAIVRHLVDLHGGSVIAANRGAAGGALFEILMPLAPCCVESASDRSPGESGSANGGTARETWPELRNLQVMVVDDDPDARDATALLLAGCGARVVTAASAAEAMSLFDREPPDVLVSDIGLPDQDGYQLLARIRARSAARGGTVPAVALTARTAPEEVRKAIQCGYRAHLAKPCDGRELVRTLAEAASGSSAEA